MATGVCGDIPSMGCSHIVDEGLPVHSNTNKHAPQHYLVLLPSDYTFTAPDCDIRTSLVLVIPYTSKCMITKSFDSCNYVKVLYSYATVLSAFMVGPYCINQLMPFLKWTVLMGTETTGNALQNSCPIHVNKRASSSGRDSVKK